MAIEFTDIEFKTKLDFPKKSLVAIMPPPCMRERARSVEGLAKALGIKMAGSADVPHGFVFGGANGQVEIFSASGAVRARNTDQLSRYEDERRNWAELVDERTEDGTIRTLGRKTSTLLLDRARKLLEEAGLAVKPASARISLGQWAQLDEKGKEVAAGVGRATAQLAYAYEGLPLIGAGAKTNVHFDPDERGTDGVIARFFHVHRDIEAMKDLPLLQVEKAFAPLLTRTWSGVESQPKHTRMTITDAEFGLLALPADLPQRFAAPALRVEGTVDGLMPRDGREVSIRFGEYLPLVGPEALAEIGVGSAGGIVPGEVTKSRDVVR